MANRTIHTEKAVKQALKKNRGLIAHSAKSLGVAVQTMYNYLDRWPDARELMLELRSQMVDTMESKLWDMIENKGDKYDHRVQLNAIRFGLSSIAKDRGYGSEDQQNLQGSTAFQRIEIGYPEGFDEAEVIEEHEGRSNAAS